MIILVAIALPGEVDVQVFRFSCLVSSKKVYSIRFTICNQTLRKETHCFPSNINEMNVRDAFFSSDSSYIIT